MSSSKPIQIVQDYDVGRDVSTSEANLRPLSRGERACLAVLLNPAYFDANTATKAAGAGVSVQQWYKIVRDPFFTQIQRSVMLNVAGERVRPLLEAALMCATHDGFKGYQDRRMLLEMCGMLGDKNARHREGRDASDGTVAAVKAFEDIDDGIEVSATSKRITQSSDSSITNGNAQSTGSSAVSYASTNNNNVVDGANNGNGNGKH